MAVVCYCAFLLSNMKGNQTHKLQSEKNEVEFDKISILDLMISQFDNNLQNDDFTITLIKNST